MAKKTTKKKASSAPKTVAAKPAAAKAAPKKATAVAAKAAPKKAAAVAAKPAPKKTMSRATAKPKAAVAKAAAKRAAPKASTPPAARARDLAPPPLGLNDLIPVALCRPAPVSLTAEGVRDKLKGPPFNRSFLLLAVSDALDFLAGAGTINPADASGRFSGKCS
jgi:hypothetical protein